MPVLFLFSVLSLCCGPSPDPTGPGQEVELTSLSGPYLGQTPPGSTPVLFAPGYVSQENVFEHSGAVFSPDGTEVYWAAKPDGDGLFHIYFMKLVDGRWTAPAILSFTESHEGNRPTFSPDGQRLYFETIRNPLGGPILYVEREGEGWSEPSALPASINATGLERPYSVTEDGSLYFGRGLRETDEILVSRMVEGQLTAPTPVEGPIDSPYTELHAFVSPDEDYMIIEVTDHQAYCALEISYRADDGTWSEPVPLDVGWARFPVVSPDGDYLFFMTRDAIFWVSASFVEELRSMGGG
jgi:Tol biopolymer transport system component